MIEIDGGSGGGQMLRTALTMSTITGENFRIKNIRGSRSNPGLKRQHMECVKAAGRLCDAKINGNKIESQRLEFKPGALRNESFTSNIDTAGSTTLLIDTVLPITTQFSEPFRLEVKGGTDVKWSPTAGYLQRVKIPLLEKFGMAANVDAKRTGFYPTGNGKIRVETSPFSMENLDLKERGDLEKFEIYSKASRDLEEQKVADRQADELARKLKNSHISTDIEKKKDYFDSDSTGSSLVLKAEYENSIAGFDALGEQGKRSEAVAAEVLEDFRSFRKKNAAVDRYMADQLMIFISLIGGQYRISRLTEHFQTNIEVLKHFGRIINVEEREKSYIVSG